LLLFEVAAGRKRFTGMAAYGRLKKEAFLDADTNAFKGMPESWID
jgi:hypothetical protein